MRFYTKITPAFWINFITASLWIYLGLFAHTSFLHGFYRMTSFLWLSILLSSVLAQVFFYWEIHVDSLYERRLWATRTVSFTEIVRVVPSTFGKKPRPGWLEIDFFRPGPFSARGTLRLAPAHLQEFVATLRHAAPQATFETS